MIAARVTPGAISLSSSSHFALIRIRNDKAGNVAARPRQALNEAGADRIDDLHEHDRHGAGRLQQRLHGRSAGGQDDVRRERNQFRRMFANRSASPRPSGYRSARCGHRPAQLLQPLHGTPLRRACTSGSSAASMSTPMRRIRSGCCARAASGHAAAPPSSVMNSRRSHSITSSARASSDRRHVEAERLRGLEVDDQLELGRLHDRQVGRLLALENRST